MTTISTIEQPAITQPVAAPPRHNWAAYGILYAALCVMDLIGAAVLFARLGIPYPAVGYLAMAILSAAINPISIFQANCLSLPHAGDNRTAQLKWTATIAIAARFIGLAVALSPSMLLYYLIVFGVWVTGVMIWMLFNGYYKRVAVLIMCLFLASALDTTNKRVAARMIQIGFALETK